MIRHDDLRYEPHLALALGGGGALGAAHVGVLQVLHERGIAPSTVVGTSIGAVMGAAYAAEIDPYELEELVLNAEWGDFGTLSITPGLGLLNTDGLRKTIESVTKSLKIEDLPIRYGAVASDIAKGDSVLLDSGDLYPAVAASISVPGIFRPPTLNGHRLIDGGVYQNLPLEAAFEMGAKHVIGVRLVPEWDTFAMGFSSVKVHELEIRSDVTLITPKLGHRSQWVKRDIPWLIDAGREAAELTLAEYDVLAPRPVRVAAAAKESSDSMPEATQKAAGATVAAQTAVPQAASTDDDNLAGPPVDAAQQRRLGALFRRR